MAPGSEDEGRTQELPGSSAEKTWPGLMRSASSFSLGSKHSDRSQVSGSAGSDHSGSGISHKSVKSDKWSYLFKGDVDDKEAKALTPMPVQSGELKSDERKISLNVDGIAAFPSALNKVRSGKPNTLRTARFTLVTWLPLSLAQQFRRVANIYFLFICVIVCFPWSPKAWHSKLGPFLLVLFWTACKDMYEDLRRRRDDKAENSQPVLRFAKGKVGTKDKFELVTWDKVLVGDVLFVEKDKAFPADLLLAHPAGGDECFISTVMLDGETSLKERNAPSIFEAFSRECGKRSTSWMLVQSNNDEFARNDSRSETQKSEPSRAQTQTQTESSRAATAGSRCNTGGSNDSTPDRADTATESCYFEDQDGPAVQNWQEIEPEIHKYLSIISRVGMDIKLAAPTAQLHDVRGAIHLRSEEGAAATSAICPFTEHNFLPRGCILRNTPWVLGIATYVGDDTKSRMNAMQGRVSKFSNMQVHLNNCIRGLLVFLFALCTGATIVSQVGEGTLSEKTDDHWIIKFFQFAIIFYHIVPLSLYVVYEMLKLLLGFRLSTDKQMFDPQTGEGALPRTADLMEEMGQISFIFSDKTGTLTRNEMVFAQCDIAGMDMGEFRGDDAPGLAKVRKVLESGAPTDTGAPPLKDPMFHSVLDFWTCLAVCHSVVRQRGQSTVLSETSTIASTNLANNPHRVSDSENSSVQGSIYSGASPDEVALVDAARQAGIKFAGRRRKYGGVSSELTITGPGNRTRSFTQLFELPFSSDRKRMSVLVRHRGEIWCITKGADTVMEELLREPLSAESHEHLLKYAGKGLRTLVVGMKRVSPEEWVTWSSEYIAARESIAAAKERGMDAVSAKMEMGLKFVGITAVEDRLQDQVPETIRLVKEMGIRLWVLTGDKTETAVDIARSCSLFTADTTLAYAVKASGAKDAEDRLLKAYSELEGKESAGIVFDGQTLLHALKSPECRKVIYDLGMVSRSCICARLSPKQKLQLVQLVREQDPKTITLSVGDGANDVPMIYGAHLGVAIRGKEGTQAVQASDIAVSQFRFLVPLLQCHGRRAYRRVSTFLCFFLYKNIALIMLDVVWMIQYKFKGMVAVPEWLSIMYNPAFTSLQMLTILALDTDLPDHAANTTPSLYKVGPQFQLFNPRVFSKWVLLGCYHGAVCWMIPYTILEPDIESVVKTEPSDFWVSSVTSFTAVVFVVCLKLILVAQNPFGLHTWLPTLLSFGAYFTYVVCISYVPLGYKMQPNMKGLPAMMAEEKMTAPCVAMVCGVALFPDVIENLVRRFCFPSLMDKVRREAAVAEG